MQVVSHSRGAGTEETIGPTTHPENGGMPDCSAQNGNRTLAAMMFSNRFTCLWPSGLPNRALWTLIGLILCRSHVQSAEPPRFQAINVTANGEAAFRLEVTRGKTYRLEMSSTLSGWTHLTTKTAENTLLEFAEPALTAGSARFYRALEVSADARPANDNFAAAADLKGSLATGRGSNAGATPEIGEPEHSWLDSGKTSVWWKWTAIEPMRRRTLGSETSRKSRF
jgi:hypothetical protein